MKTSLNKKQLDKYLSKIAKENRVKNDKKILDKQRKMATQLSMQQRNARHNCEMIFRKMLFRNNIKHIWQKPFWNKKRYVCVDFYIPHKKMVIEIDGSNHSEPYDKERTKYLKTKHKRKVIDLIRVSNMDLLNNPDLIEEFVVEQQLQ